MLKRKFSVMGFIIAATLLASLASCSQAMKNRLEDGYQFGDLTSAQKENLEIYCESTDPKARAAARAALGAVVGTAIPLNPCGLRGVIDSTDNSSDEPGSNSQSSNLETDSRVLVASRQDSKAAGETRPLLPRPADARAGPS